MKNIAIPLLLAGSAKAEAKKKAAMLQDYAEPEPILIASSWTGDVCEDEDGEVAAALTALTTAQGEVTTLEEGLEALEEALDTALENRRLAIEAVLNKETTMATAVSTNNDNIRNLIELKSSWDEAKLAASVGEADLATKLGLKGEAENAYNSAVLAYTGDPNDSNVNGADGDWNTATTNQSNAEGVRDNNDATTVGSIALRDAQHIAYKATDCADSTVAITGDSRGAGVTGTVGTNTGNDALTIQCGALYQGSLTGDYSDYSVSLSELETVMNEKLTLRDTAEATKAAKYLKKIEYNQLQKYVGYAVANALVDKDMGTNTPATKFDITVAAGRITSVLGYWDANPTRGQNLTLMPQVVTQANIIAEMNTQNSTLDVTTNGQTANQDSKAKAWLQKLQLVYGKVTSPNTQNNTALDGDGDASDTYLDADGNSINGTANDIVGTVDSAEQIIINGETLPPASIDSTSKTYGAWVSATAAQVSATLVYFDAYNAVANAQTLAEGEKSTDAYASAYTEVKSGSGGTYSGPCVCNAGDGCNAISTWTITKASAASGADYDSDVAAVIGMQTDTPASIGGATYAAGASSLCAEKCSANTHWLVDASTNLPYTMLTSSANSNQLYTTDSAAATAGTQLMTNTSCTGFEATLDGTTSGNQVTCKGFYGAIPVGNASLGSEASPVLDMCWSRDMSVAADTYSKAVVQQVAGTASYDAMMLGMTAWQTAYENLTDARAELDIATYYYDQLNAEYTNTTNTDGDVNLLDTPGLVEQYNYAYTSGTNNGTSLGHLPDYTAADSTYTTAVNDYNLAESNYNARAVLIASANSDYLLAQAQLDNNNALISKLTILTEIALAAKNVAEQAKNDAETAFTGVGGATEVWEAARDAYEGVAASGQVLAVDGYAELATAAQEAYESAYANVYGDGVDPNPTGTQTALGVYAAATDTPAGSGDLLELFNLRATARTEFETLEGALSDLVELNDDISDAQDVVKDKLADHLLAIVACKVENYDAYLTTLQLAEQQRETDLETILALVTADEEAEPEAGAAGSRCEKALSNGTFRPQRGETTCNEGLCCGAARIPDGNVMMTIETCQAEGTTEYSYVAPREPMATTAPAAVKVDFVCIEGAKKLAAAASALATAVYMLA